MVTSLVPVTACVAPPDDAIADATRAFDRAIEAEARRYSPESLALASQTLDLALEEVDRQKQRPIPFRDYARARGLLGQARELARGARYEAQARRDEIRRETVSILEEASRDLAVLEEVPPSAARLDGTEWTSWIRQFRAASDGLVEARRAFRDGDYFDAQQQAERVLEQLRHIDRTPGDPLS